MRRAALFLALFLVSTPAWAASRYFVGGGTGNWNSTTNWAATDGGSSGETVPGSGDDVFLTATSGANTLTVNVASAAKSINCTGFTGSLVLGANLSVSGSITLVSGMTWTPSTYTVTQAAAGTVTSNGKHFYKYTISGWNGTLVLGDDMYVDNTFTCNQYISVTGAYTVHLAGDVAIGSGVGFGIDSYAKTTASISIEGSGNQLIQGPSRYATAGCGAAVTVASTGGVVKWDNVSSYFFNSLTVSSGTVDFTTNTSSIYFYGRSTEGRNNININVPSATFYNLSFAGDHSSGTGNISLAGNVTVNNNFEIYGGFTEVVNSTVYVKGNFTASAAATYSSCTTAVNLNGTGTQTVDISYNASYPLLLPMTWSGSGVVQFAAAKNHYIGASLTYNGTGEYKWQDSTINFKTGTMTYTAGTMTPGTATLKSVGDSNYNLGTSFTVPVFQVSTAGTATLTGDIKATDVTVDSSRALALGSNELILLDDFVNNGSVTAGTGKITLDGAEAAQVFSGNGINFYDFEYVSAEEKTITFASTKTYGFSGTVLIIQPYGGSTVTLNASTPDSVANFNITGDQQFERLTVADIACTGDTGHNYKGTVDAESTGWDDSCSVTPTAVTSACTWVG